MAQQAGTGSSQSLFTLHVQGRVVQLEDGVFLSKTQLPTLEPSSSAGPVAEVNHNPNDPSVLGLKNLSQSSWTATLPNGTQRTINTGQSIKLTADTRVAFGSLVGEIRDGNPVGQSQAGTSRRPHVQPLQGHQQPSLSVSLGQLFPLASTGRDLMRKAFLLPAIVTVMFVVLMFGAVGNPQTFNLLLATYLAAGAFYIVYQLCGKRKPWWVLLAPAAATCLMLVTQFVFVILEVIFRRILPGSIPEPNAPFLTSFIHFFFGAGLLEELFKALPVLALYWIGCNLRSPWKERVGVWEPLDGILLASSSAVGFTLMETMGQYVPQAMKQAAILVTPQMGEGAGIFAGQWMGLQLLIPRLLGQISGHMAYSGYLGYFIGLSVLKPHKRWEILGVGYLTAATLHALWNASSGNHALIQAVEGALSYAFLAAAILKARALSPTRSQNFASYSPGQAMP